MSVRFFAKEPSNREHLYISLSHSEGESRFPLQFPLEMSKQSIGETCRQFLSSNISAIYRIISRKW